MRRFTFLLATLFIGACVPAPSTISQPTAMLAQPTSSTSTEAQPTPLNTSPAGDDTPTSPASVGRLPDPGSFRWVLVADGLQSPLDLQHAGDERLFVAEQRGVIRVMEEGALQAEPFLDIQDIVNDGGSEQGLLGLAFHPDFVENGRFFVNYTDSSSHTVVARMQASSEALKVDPNSLQVIIRFEQPFANHNGGGLAFGPDGYLYIGTGDGGSANDPMGNGQNLNTLLGKLLRLDVDSSEPYTIPPDNPFANGGGLPEIWAYGLRNPWRFVFDRLTGDLYTGDVGQNKWEEVNFQPAQALGGANYGWSLREGAHPFTSEITEGLTDPIAEYSHSQGCSVTGGVVVRQASLPEWDGVYLYGDYCSGAVWGLLHQPDGSWENAVLFDTNFSISSFGEDVNARVYLVDHEGAVYRLERTP
jgi:glucose/arabinose dehydrogenase